MATDGSWALQKAIFEVLAADAALAALLGGPNIFDDVPGGAAFPYVTFGAMEAEEVGTQTDAAREHRVTLHAWSRQGGRREAAEILAAIETALGAGAIEPEDHVLVNFGYEASELLRDEDGETFQGVVRFRAVTEPVGR